MDLQQLRYVIEVERSGSISQSANNLFMAQSNLSNALKELENDIGIKIFTRNRKGVEVTAEGAVFIAQIKNILDQVETLETTYRNKKEKAATIRCAYVRSSNITNMFCEIVNEINSAKHINLYLKETSHIGAIKGVVNREVDIARIIFPSSYLKFYRNYAKNNSLQLEVLWKVDSYIIVSAHSPLCNKASITADMLKDYIEIDYGDMDMHDLPTSAVLSDQSKIKSISQQTITCFDRCTAMELLSNCPDTYLLTISTHQQVIKRYNLVAIPWLSTEGAIVEALVYPKNKPKKEQLDFLIDRFKQIEYTEEFITQEKNIAEN